MKSNEDLQKDVQNALKWEPLLNAAEIGVTAKDGVVTLTGVVDSYYKKSEAENAAKNVLGVKVVVEKIEIKYSNIWAKKDDNEIATEVVNALMRNWTVNDQDIDVKVAGTKVTLSGKVGSWFQKEEAERIAWNAPGIWNIDNLLAVDYALSLID